MSIVHVRDGGISIVTLQRPEKLNALNSEMFAQLIDILQEEGSDGKLRALILTGSGERAFCAGTDITDLSDLTPALAHGVSKRGQHLCQLLESFPVPVIAAVNGIAAGGGFELVLACHIRMASTDATFSLPEIRLGLIPGYGGSQRLPREVGLGRARELMLTGKKITAKEAYDIGLINHLVSPEHVLDEALSFAHVIQKNSASAIRACIKAVTEGIEKPLSEGLALEAELFASLFAGEDVREGTAAFLEKREPEFS